MVIQDTQPQEKKEEERIETLRQYAILDTSPDENFDRVLRLASRLIDCPMALISLVDTDRIWFLSKLGIDLNEIPRTDGFCSAAILSNEVYCVENTLENPGTMSNPLVIGSVGVRFYAAAPLRTKDGHNLGALCVLDKVPRRLTDGQKEVLKSLSEIVMDQLDLCLALRISAQAQNSMAHKVAHDLKGPLQSIPILTNMLIESIDEPKAAQELCTILSLAADKSVKTINTFLESVENATFPSEYNFEKLNLTEAIKKVVDMNQVLAIRKEQRIVFNSEEVFINGDEHKIMAAADNLINNAVKFSPNGKKIVVNLKKSQERAVLEIIDEGPGFSEEDMEHVFKRFARLSAKPTGKECSSGLGLSIAKEIVDAHSGCIWIEKPDNGKGAKFIVRMLLHNDH